MFGYLNQKNVGWKYAIDFHPDQETINVIIVIKPLLKMTKNLYQIFDNKRSARSVIALKLLHVKNSLL